MACSLITLILQILGREIIFCETITAEKIALLLVAMAFLAINLLFCHLMVTKMGKIFVKAKVCNKDDEQLLDAFEEGIIILDID